MKKKTLLFNFSNSNSIIRLLLLHADFTDLNAGSLSNDDGDDNESGKKAIGQESVYMEVGDPS